MRMWLVDPKVLCSKHLIAEHNEIHMFVGSIRKNINISGYVTKGLVDTAKLQERHDMLVIEMLARGFKHRSQMQYADTLAVGAVNLKTSYTELAFRCPHCRALILANGYLKGGEVPPSINYSSVAYEKERKLNPHLTKEEYQERLLHAHNSI